MAAELEKFIAHQLGNLPSDHPDRALIEGVSRVLDAYLTKDVVVYEVPRSTLPTRGESIQFAAELPLGTRGKGTAAHLYAQGKIITDQDLCHITDYDLGLIYHVGQKTIANIREFYPYSPRQEISKQI